MCIFLWSPNLSTLGFSHFGKALKLFSTTPHVQWLRCLFKHIFSNNLGETLPEGGREDTKLLAPSWLVFNEKEWYTSHDTQKMQTVLSVTAKP